VAYDKLFIRLCDQWRADIALLEYIYNVMVIETRDDHDS
jgi:hypothetical protein